jgi:hypothetical protein
MRARRLPEPPARYSSGPEETLGRLEAARRAASAALSPRSARIRAILVCLLTLARSRGPADNNRPITANIEAPRTHASSQDACRRAAALR